MSSIKNLNIWLAIFFRSNQDRCSQCEEQIWIMRAHKLLTVCLGLWWMTGAAMAQGVAESGGTDAQAKESPWLLVPILTSDPKLGTSGGAMAAYLHRFDPKSTISMFGVQGLYTSTHSKIGALFARTFFGEDRHRLFVVALSGQINNDYSDYLNTGFPLQSQDNIHGVFARYLYRAYEDWFVGLQLADTNYQIIAADPSSQEILDQLGVTGFDSAGGGLVVNYDSRDNVNTPSSGLFGDANNLAYSKDFGGSASFDAYRLTLKQYFPHGDGNVFAWKLSNHWTVNAPPSGYATLRLRGYTAGQYLGPNMTSLEAEERIRIGERWGLTAFTGIAKLYGDTSQTNPSLGSYADIGGGLYFMLKPKDKIAATLEYADGKGSNYGIYMRLGWGF